ncbi:MAG: response regulator [Elusimicrobia bacterium]|nr:response regulator [Elusimicrobiota bacterium]
MRENAPFFTILLVEDDEALRKSSAKGLKACGYAVLEAATAPEAEKILRESGKYIEILFSDMMMPGKNGMELADEIASLFPGIKVVLTSGSFMEEPLLEAMRQKGYRFLPKPYDINSIMSLLTRI